jgi:hypothetical protein
MNHPVDPSLPALPQPVEDLTETSAHHSADAAAPGWWNSSLSRRDVNRASLGLAALFSLEGVGLLSGCSCCEDGDSTTTETEYKTVTVESLDIQKEEGWNVDSLTDPLKYGYDASPKDSQGTERQAVLYNYTGAKTDALIDAIKPAQPAWLPHLKPTLAQSLAQTTKNQPKLIEQLNLVYNDKIQEAYDKGVAVSQLVANSEAPSKTLLVVDLPGPEAVAFAAGAADTIDPVFQFDHWPHPKGIVPAHETLGALLYYAAELSQKRAERVKALTAPPAEHIMPEGAPADAYKVASPPTPGHIPTAIILDSRRLAAGKDPNPTTEFDNRYLAAMPSKADLVKLGITSLLYITDKEVQSESDDLNDDFADLNQGDTKVANVSLDAFQPDPNAPKDVGTTTETSVTTTTTTTHTASRPRTHYYYGGGYYGHTHFYSHYPMYHYYPTPYYGSIWVSQYSPRSRAPVGRSPSSYKPTPRPTKYSSRTTGGAKGVGRTKPTGFGKVSTKRDSGGKFVGTSTSPKYRSTSSGSSGSRGRSSSSSSS